MSAGPNVKAGIVIKVYLVCRFLNLAQQGQPNIEMLAAKLTRRAAQQIVDEHTGTFIQKLLAVK